LSGLSPTTILDIASRALNFYTYQAGPPPRSPRSRNVLTNLGAQVQQEAAFQALITKNAQEVRLFVTVLRSRQPPDYALPDSVSPC